MIGDLTMLWQAAVARTRQLRQDRRTLRDLEKLDEASRRDFGLLLARARDSTPQPRSRSKRATSSRCGDQTKLSIGRTLARR